jgi:hypothetical protein
MPAPFDASGAFTIGPEPQDPEDAFKRAYGNFVDNTSRLTDAERGAALPATPSPNPFERLTGPLGPGR